MGNDRRGNLYYRSDDIFRAFQEAVIGIFNLCAVGACFFIKDKACFAGKVSKSSVILLFLPLYGISCGGSRAGCTATDKGFK